MSILDDDHFPSSSNDGMLLIRVLAAMFKTQEQAMMVATPYGFDELSLPDRLSPLDRWKIILVALAAADKVRPCVEAVVAMGHNHSEMDFLKKLVADRPRIKLPGSGAAAATSAIKKAEPFKPWELLHKFDRTEETGLLAQQFLALPEPKRKPIVIGILAERDDEYTYFVRRINSDNLNRLSPIAWPGAIMSSFASAAVSAETEISEFARKQFGIVGNLDKVLSQLGPEIAGKPVSIELRCDEICQPPMLRKLDDFLGLWSRLGPQDPPSVLYLAVVRWDDGELPLAQARSQIEAAFARAEGLIRVTPIELSFCEARHFTEWQSELIAARKQIDEIEYERLKRSFPSRFRLADLRLKLETHRIYD